MAVFQHANDGILKGKSMPLGWAGTHGAGRAFSLRELGLELVCWCEWAFGDLTLIVTDLDLNNAANLISQQAGELLE